MRAGRGRCRRPKLERGDRAGGRSRGSGGAASTCCWGSTASQTLVMHLRMTGNLSWSRARSRARPLRGAAALRGRALHLRAPPARPLHPRRRPRGLVHRPAPLRRGLPDRRRQAARSASPGSGSSRSRRSSPPRRWARWRPGETAPLKSFLLDQSGIAGVGNIYADEALFRARLHPLSPAGSMKPEHLEALRDAVVAALEAGIDAGGSSIDDYRDGRGEKGTMQERVPRPHPRGRAVPGEDCDGIVERIVVSGRSTYFCPSCQVRLRRRPRSAAGRRST